MAAALEEERAGWVSTSMGEDINGLFKKTPGPARGALADNADLIVANYKQWDAGGRPANRSQVLTTLPAIPFTVVER